MEKFKVIVENRDSEKDIILLCKALGLFQNNWSEFDYPKFISNNLDGFFSDYLIDKSGIVSKYKEITIPQLKDMVVLKRNSIDDATHIDEDNYKYYIGNSTYLMTAFEWHLCKSADINSKLKPIEKEMKTKEYLNPLNGGGYELSNDALCVNSIEVPEGAEIALKHIDSGDTYFYKDDYNLMAMSSSNKWECSTNFEHKIKDKLQYMLNNYGSTILWQRPQQPDSLPFVDDETLSDKLKSIEVARQDNVNNPSHYSDSVIECIDAMEAMMTPEQFIGYLRGNVFKYQWRYEKKNGIEDLKKAQWYLNKLTIKVAEKDAPF